MPTGACALRSREDATTDPPQPDLFAPTEAPQPFVGRGDPDRVRARLTKILAEARAADIVPWSRHDQGLYELIVPQMKKWLPADQAARWCCDFADELARLRAAGSY